MFTKLKLSKIIWIIGNIVLIVFIIFNIVMLDEYDGGAPAQLIVDYVLNQRTILLILVMLLMVWFCIGVLINNLFLRKYNAGE